ncbi:NYNRI protein, partial [Amia calva]|nr:NYNRI protein [Amia calva]
MLSLPVTRTALRSFLGLMGYQRDFIPEFATFAKPLYELLRKEVPKDFYTNEIWTENHTKAVEQLKQALVQATVLLTPNPTLPFHLEVGSSKEALTTMLCQERHGVLKPVTFTSRCLQGVETLVSDFLGSETFHLYYRTEQSGAAHTAYTTELVIEVQIL